MRCCIYVIVQNKTHCLQSGSFFDWATSTLHYQLKIPDIYLKSTAAYINQIKEHTEVIHGYKNDRLFILASLSYVGREKSHKNFFSIQEL